MLKMYLYWDLSYFHLGGFQSISISGELKVCANLSCESN